MLPGPPCLLELVGQLAEAGTPERGFAHLRGEAGGEAVPGEEVVEGGVGQLPAVGAVHRVILEPGGRVLSPDHHLVLRVVGRVGAEAAQHGLFQLGAGCPDGQHHRQPLFPGGQGYHLVDFLVDPAGFVDQGEGVVQPFQPLRHHRRT